MKTRLLTGMHVTEFRAATQAQLLKDVAKWLREGFISLSSIDLSYNEDGREAEREVAVVVWA